jgi:hypothetical protein
MTVNIDFNDARSVVAATLALALDVASTIEHALPPLLNQRGSGGLGVVARRMEGEQLFHRFVVGSLEHLVADCEKIAKNETTTRTTWVVARHIGGDEELEPLQVSVRSARGDELARIAASIRELLMLIRRVEALTAADRYLGGG